MLKVTSAPAEVPNETTLPAYRGRGDNRSHEVTPERVEHDRRLELGDLLAELVGAGDDRPVGALLDDRGGLALGSGLTPDGRARRMGERDDHCPDPSRGAEHEHPVLGRHPRELADDVERGQARAPHNGRVARLNAFGQRASALARARSLARAQTPSRTTPRPSPATNTERPSRTPAASAPSVRGSGPSGFTRPAATYVSTGLTPPNSSSTRTSSPDGSRSSTSSMTRPDDRNGDMWIREFRTIAVRAARCAPGCR